MFALHATDLGSIPPSLSESPASYREYRARTAEPGKLPVACWIMPKTVTISLTMRDVTGARSNKSMSNRMTVTVIVTYVSIQYVTANCVSFYSLFTNLFLPVVITSFFNGARYQAPVSYTHLV